MPLSDAIVRYYGANAVYHIWQPSNLIEYSTGSTKSEAESAERAGIFLKNKLKEKEVTYVDLVKRLKRHGFTETDASITNKLKRGTFSATFFLACVGNGT
jgi:hypothetical protein